MTQLETSARRPAAALLGAVFGGTVPWLGRAVAHGELPDAWVAGHRALAALLVVVVLGCACFSMVSVYKFGLSAFGDRRKAVGFVLALEGVMLVAHGATSAVALALLVVLNAVANGCTIATARDATLRRREADERRQSTRAQTRAATRAEAQSSRAPAAAGPRNAGSPRSTPRPVPATHTTPRGRWQLPPSAGWTGDVEDAVVVREWPVYS